LSIVMAAAVVPLLARKQCCVGTVSQEGTASPKTPKQRHGYPDTKQTRPADF
jgi:hypothetical protein